MAKGISSIELPADHVEVTENSKQNGIELLFNREPVSELQSKMRAVGFRPSKIKNMWYCENNAYTKAFAINLKSVIETSNAGPDLLLNPSFESTQLNIEKKEFSFVIVRLKDEQLKNYIVFEPSKPKAEVIAIHFAKDQFGEQFSGVAVKPRTQIREARILFNEGKIIPLKRDVRVPESATTVIELTELEKQGPGLKAPGELIDELSHPTKKGEAKDPLANEHGIYTRQTAGENFEQISIPIPKTAQYEASIEIAKRTDGRFVIGIDASKKFGDFSGNSYGPGLTDKSYPTRNDALQAGLKEHEARLRVQLNTPDQILQSNEKKNRQLTIALNALHAFAKANNIALDSEQSETSKDSSVKPVSKKKKQGQHNLNNEIEALIDERDTAQESFTEDEKNKLRLYAGSGGLIKQGATGKGILYEYYTPDTVIKKMWDIAYHFGYDGGDVLEPSVGIGSFLKYAPKGAALIGYEVNHYAARIAQILYPTAQIHEAAFETNFFAGNVHLKDDYADKRYSLVIGNPPYGEFSGRYAGMGEKKWTGMTQYEHYFTYRGLDLLKSGGLLVFILPSNFLKADAYSGIARKIAAKCTGLDRYYLGTDIFKTTDIETDIIALRKN
jgi:hypothetical protein